MLLLRNNAVAWIIWLMIMMVVFGDDVQSDHIDIDSDNKKQPYRLSQVHQLCKLVLVEVAILTAVVHVHLLQFKYH